MLGSHDIIAFVATKNAPRARPFYEGVLGLRLIDDNPYAMVFDAHGTILRVQKVQQLTTAPYTVLGWKVPDLHAKVVDLTARGVVFERYGSLAQDESGIWTAPDGARVAWFKDPDGNTLSLTQF